ncbi:hypothetical protein COOONC_04878 [Cooperia oncophora]
MKKPIFITPYTKFAHLKIREALIRMHSATAHTITEVLDSQAKTASHEDHKKCVTCQRINNLPYRYPKMKDLPERRSTEAFMADRQSTGSR